MSGAHLRSAPPGDEPTSQVPEAERLARVALSCAVEPGDGTTSSLVRQMGAERALEKSRAATGGEPGEMLAQRLVEVDAVRQLGGLRMRAPWMEFDRVELRQFEQPGLIVHHQIVRACATLFFQRHHVDALHARRMVLLEETRPARALRTTDDRQRATLDFRQQPSCHRTVIVEDLPFCDATVGEYHAFGVRQCDRLRIGTAGGIGRRHRCFLCVS